MKALALSVFFLASSGWMVTNGAAATAKPLPDWSGAWIVPLKDFSEAILREQNPADPTAPDLLPAAAVVAVAQMRRLITGEDPDGMKPRTNGEQCLPAGMPDIMRYPVGLNGLVFQSDDSAATFEAMTRNGAQAS